MQSFFAIWYNFLVFELSFPPITTMASHFSESSLQLFWRRVVALQMVLFASNFTSFRPKTSVISSRSSFLMVVWHTRKRFSPFISSASSSEFTIKAFPSHHPFMPFTSGCSRSPTMSTCFPASNAFSASICIFFTKGQVASTTVISSASASSKKAFPSP